MYFKVRCLREKTRVILSLLTFFVPFSLLTPLLMPAAEWVFGSLLDDWLIRVLSWASGIILGLLLQFPLQFYKVYEFTDREIHVQWWYGAWAFYANWLGAAPKKRLRRGESPLAQIVDETPVYRGYPDEFESEIITEQLSRGARPAAVLGKSWQVKTIHRWELHDVKILESVFGATLLLRFRGCGEFRERFVWQYWLHNRGKLFVLRLSKAQGEEAWAKLKEYTRR